MPYGSIYGEFGWKTNRASWRSLHWCGMVTGWPLDLYEHPYR